MAITLDQTLSAARIAVGFAGGIVTTLGINAIDPATLQEGFNHIFNGAKEIGVGIGILAPMGAAAWGVIKNSRKAKLLSAAADPDVSRIVIKPTATPAAQEMAHDNTLPKITPA